jgi:CRP-like cAMP-binding protein
MSQGVEKRRPELPNPPSALSSLAVRKLICGDSNFDYGLQGEIKHIRKNKDIVVAGNHYEALFVNHDGWLFRYKILHNGDRQILDFILPGQIFGLQACLFKASLYSVATITEASLSSIPLDAIDRVFERTPTLAKALFWSALCESAIVSEHLINTGRRSAYERVSHLLLELFVRLKSAGLTDDMSFKMPLTQELIGSALGLTTVHVNRTLRSLREDKLIAIDGMCVTILDFDALSLLSDFDNSYLGETVRALRGEMTLSVQNNTAQHTASVKSNFLKRNMRTSDTNSQISRSAAGMRHRIGDARQPRS